MTALRDETWRLAVAGDAAALHRVADLPVEEYDAHRARAFALAVEGHVDRALAELNEGWTDDWPFPSAYAADIARVHVLAGNGSHALGALDLAVRGAERLDPSVGGLLAAVAPHRRVAAARVAVSGGTPAQRLRNLAAVAATGWRG